MIELKILRCKKCQSVLPSPIQSITKCKCGQVYFINFQNKPIEKIENKDGHLGHASEWDLAKIMYNFEEDKRGLLDKVFKEYKAKILSEI